MQTMEKIILDCDPGHDDAAAIILAAKSPKLQLLGITVVAGNQTLENTQRVTQEQLLNMQENEETCRRLRRQLADAEARNQELEQRCAQLKVQADEYESLKDHVAQIEISAHRRTEQFREEAVTRLRQLAARQREWCRTAQADYEQMNCQLLERLQQAEQTLRQPDMSSFRRMEEGLTALEKGLTAPEKAGE